MTADEWVEIVEWINQRWPKAWRGEQDVAFFDDLKGFDASDVWTALHAIYASGLTFAPNGSMIVAKLLALKRDTAAQARYDTPSLPAPTGTEMPVGGWLAKWYPDEQVTWTEHIRRVHEKKGPCGSKYCDIHCENPIAI